MIFQLNVIERRKKKKTAWTCVESGTQGKGGGGWCLHGRARDVGPTGT